MRHTLARVIAWARQHERRLSSLFFLGGFVGDVIAFTLLDVSVVNVIFLVYIALGGVAILLTHYIYSHHLENTRSYIKALSVALPLFVQYAIGATLSGSLIFYTKSATLLVSWPFLLLLAAVFFGNEWFRSYREHLAFQATLFFFGFYAYVIFALPLLLKTIGAHTFFWSSLIAAGVFGTFLLLLYIIGRKRFSGSVRAVAAGSVAILVAMNAAYVTGVLPPLPLGLKEIGIYHEVSRTADGYRVVGEGRASVLESFLPKTVHQVPGMPLYAYSAVAAPIRFSATVVHEWEKYDQAQKRWVSVTRVSFPVSGGRLEGYRGYSVKGNPEPGRWRVSVKTPQGQTIGRTTFTVESVQELPPLVSETR